MPVRTLPALPADPVLPPSLAAPDSDEVSGASDRRRSRLLVGLVVLVVWGLITHGTFAGSGDEPHYMVIAHSLAFDGDLDLTNNYRDAPLIGGGTLEPEAHAIVRDGRLRPVHDIGMPLLLAPAVAVTYMSAEWLGRVVPSSVLDRARLNASLLLRHQMSLVMALLTGLAAREVLLILRRMGATASSGFNWALLFALTPPVLSHSFLFFTEIPTTLLSLYVFRKLALEPVTSLRVAGIVGLLAGLLLLIHTRNIGLVAGLTLVAFRHSRQFLLAMMAGVAIALLARAAILYGLWGTFVTTPLASLTPTSVGEIGRQVLVRISGMLFDRESGLFPYGPIYLLAAPGLLLLRTTPLTTARPVRLQPVASATPERRASPFDTVGWHATLVAVCYVLPILLPFTNPYGWAGGWSPAARFLVPITPLLWLGVYACATRVRHYGVWFVTCLVVLQVALNAYFWQFPRSLWNDQDGVTAFAGAAWLPSWTDAGAALWFAVAFVAAGVITLACVRSGRCFNRSTRVQM